MSQTTAAGARHIDALALLGGRRALDFANTAGNHAGNHPSEWLTSYAELAAWGAYAGIVSHAEERELQRLASRHSRAAVAALARARHERERMYRIFSAISHGADPASADLDGLRVAWIRALEAGSAAWHGVLVVSHHASPSDLLAVLHPVVLDAVDLLRSADARRVRQCENDPCGWLFLDRSKNGSRRWCSSAECGNQSRVRRFRERHRN